MAIQDIPFGFRAKNSGQKMARHMKEGMKLNWSTQSPGQRSGKRNAADRMDLFPRFELVHVRSEINAGPDRLRPRLTSWSEISYRRISSRSSRWAILSKRRQLGHRSCSQRIVTLSRLPSGSVLFLCPCICLFLKAGLSWRGMVPTNPLCSAERRNRNDNFGAMEQMILSWQRQMQHKSRIEGLGALPG